MKGDQIEVRGWPLDKPLFAVGPPGSGKAVLAIHRAKMLADNGRSVAIITYNRMLRRLATLLNESPASVQTMQSFVWYDYRGRTGKDPPRMAHDEYAYDWEAMLEELDGHPRSGPTWDHLVVDEGQDLEEDFFRYASRHVARSLTVFADEDQALRARRTTLEQIKSAANLKDPVLLHDNYRNTPEIAKVTEHFHSGRLGAAVVHQRSIRETPRLVRSGSIAETATRIANWFRTRRGTIGVVVHRNETGTQVHAELRKLLPPPNRVDIYVSGRSDEDTIELLDVGITMLNKESVKGQEFDTLFVLELEQILPCKTPAMRRVMYMLCARARDHLWLVYGPGTLSPQADAALPDEHLLERP